ncbi:hypothetical protein CAPTEDRAFT_197161 [Capitella teleta]|uniref:Chitin-binding type-2 domain-containing protein n=1 Tax=Capitella teleta TaxID=283909 RepID=R7UKW1_CAPTE|nr:hypothetical protein CAPTEDRAFT_197161 [Capitella teleta]|eukprot:ELU06875.1 hypothetical protein CAPTEDRAFT_197161 [Capitella teleta]
MTIDPITKELASEPAITIEPVTAISQGPTIDDGMTLDTITRDLTSAIPDPSTSAPEFTCPKYNATHWENRRYVYPGDCTKYYACYECMSDIFKCPWAFEYHSILQECVDPMYSDCEAFPPIHGSYIYYSFVRAVVSHFCAGFISPSNFIEVLSPRVLLRMPKGRTKFSSGRVSHKVAKAQPEGADLDVLADKVCEKVLDKLDNHFIEDRIVDVPQ